MSNNTKAGVGADVRSGPNGKSLSEPAQTNQSRNILDGRDRIQWKTILVTAVRRIGRAIIKYPRLNVWQLFPMGFRKRISNKFRFYLLRAFFAAVLSANDINVRRKCPISDGLSLL